MSQQIQHDTQQAGQTVLPRIDAVVDHAGIEADPFVHALVEDYLDRVCRPLIYTHSYNVRYDLRQELSQHIHSLIRAYEEMGDAPIAAAEKALAKFGEAESVARQWKLPATKVRRKLVHRWFRHQWQGIAATLAVSSFSMAVLGGISVRTLRVQRVAALSQAQAAQSQATAFVPNTFVHSFRPDQHQCIECHRGVPSATDGVDTRIPAVFWKLPATRQ